MIYRNSNLYQKKLEEILEFVKDYGLDPKETIFVPVDQESIFYVAANYFPVALPHWSRGKRVLSLRKSHQRGSHIYEVVFNSTPAVAYMSDMSNDAETEQVIAHVFGHSHIYKHNIYEYEDNNLLALTKKALSIYEDKLQYYSADELDFIVDFVYVFINNIDYSEEITINNESVVHKFYSDENKNKFEKFKGIKNNPKTFKEEYIIQAKKDIRKKLGINNTNIFSYIVDNSPIEEWQKELIRIEYRMLKNVIKKSDIKIVHEGFASWIDTKYLLQNMENYNFIHGSIMSSRVAYPSFDNPYWLGFLLLSFAEQNGENIAEYVKNIDDAQLISDYFSEEFFSFVLNHINEDTAPDNYSEYSENIEELKQKLIIETYVTKPTLFIDEYSIIDTLESKKYELIKNSENDLNRTLKITCLETLDYKYAVETLNILSKVWLGNIYLRYPKK